MTEFWHRRHQVIEDRGGSYHWWRFGRLLYTHGRLFWVPRGSFKRLQEAEGQILISITELWRLHDRYPWPIGSMHS